MNKTPVRVKDIMIILDGEKVIYPYLIEGKEIQGLLYIKCLIKYLEKQVICCI
jgi:hypothetical protein